MNRTCNEVLRDDDNIGSSVGLASPIFGVGGASYLWFNYMPKSAMGSFMKLTLGLFAGGGMTKLTYSYIWPFLMQNSDLVLPFAVANGVSAAFWFSAGELVFGLDRLAGRTTKGRAVEMPVLNASIMSHLKSVRSGNAIHLAAGPVIGGLTALTSPFLWPYLFSNLWPVDLQEMVLGNDPYWISHMYEFIVFPVALPVGVLSGLMMQWSLKPLVYGAPHIPWKARSLPALLAILGACVFYFTIFHQVTLHNYTTKIP